MCEQHPTLHGHSVTQPGTGWPRPPVRKKKKREKKKNKRKIRKKKKQEKERKISLEEGSQNVEGATCSAKIMFYLLAN